MAYDVMQGYGWHKGHQRQDMTWGRPGGRGMVSTLHGMVRCGKRWGRVNMHVGCGRRGGGPGAMRERQTHTKHKHKCLKLRLCHVPL